MATTNNERRAQGACGDETLFDYLRRMRLGRSACANTNATPERKCLHCSGQIDEREHGGVKYCSWQCRDAATSLRAKAKYAASKQAPVRRAS